MKVERWLKRSNNLIRVEAVRLDEDNVNAVALWANNALIVEEIDPEHPDEKQPGLNVKTAGGINKRCSLGMYVIKHGRILYVATENVLRTNYSPVGGEDESPSDVRTALGFGTVVGPRQL